MKRKVIFGYLKSSIFFILTIFLSCNDDYVGYDVQMEKLDKIGQAFMDHLLSGSDGKRQWEELTRLGDIPPNEVALVYHGSRGWQYVLPLLKDSTLIGMVALPVEIGEDNKCLSECSIGASCVLEKEDIKSDIFMQGILKSSISRKWRENGIIIDENLIVNLANSTLFSPLSRGSGGCFYASYTLEANNYLDDEGFAIINGINTGTFSEIANKVAREVHRALEITVEEDIIFVIAPTEGIAVIYYMQLAGYLYDKNITATFSFLWKDTPDDAGGGTGGGTGSGTGDSTGSGTGGNTGGNTGSNTENPPITPDDPGHIVVNLTTSVLSGEVEIGDTYYLILDIYHTKNQPIPRITNIEYLINRVGTKQGGSIGETTEWTYARKAISAGNFQFIALVHFEGDAGKINSNTVNVREMCPSISKFKDLPDIEKRAKELWNMSVNYTREHQSTYETKEYGCFIYMNTQTGKYHCGSEVIEGEPVPLDKEVEAKVHFTYSTQEYDPREPFDLIVGTLHSHYPLTWAASGVRRTPGPSSTDNGGSLPGLVYDYLYQVFAGDPVDIKDNPKQMYTYGPDRREIP